MNENLCRICLTASEQELIELFNTETSYASKFTFCSGIEISENDELPKMICSACLETVLVACDIKEKCIQTDFVLRQQLKNELTELLSVEKEDNDHSINCTDNLEDEDSYVEYLDEVIQDGSLEQTHLMKQVSSRLQTGLEEDIAYGRSKAQDFCCFFCNITFDKVHLKNLHVKTDHSTELECTICGSKKSSSLAAERCIKDHKFGFDYLCQICAKPFRRRCYLALHEATVHSKLKDHELFTCDLCGIRSKYRVNLMRHMKSVHSSVARVKYACPDCPDKFYTTQTSLNIHLYREHKVPAPVICSKCELGFTYLSELKGHRSCCRGNTNTRKSMKNTSFLKNCEVVSEGFKCKDCPRVFKQKQKWSDHYSSRHRSNRHCEACDKTFGCVSNFKRHVDTFHKKIKKFVCDYSDCGKAYTSNKNLKDHKNTHLGPRKKMHKEVT